MSWSNYTVTSDILLEQSGYVQLLGRISTIQRSPANINAYYVRVSNSGAWSIWRNSTSGSTAVLSSGAIASFGTNTWHALSVTFQGSVITEKFDGATIGIATDSTYSTGQAGIAVSGWQNAQFDNFSVVSVGTTVPTAGAIYQIVNRNSGKVLDVTGASTANGGLVIQYTGHGGTTPL